MKHYTKRIFSFFLTVCLLFGVAMPTVFAADELNDTAAQTTVYDFGKYANNGDYIANRTADIYRSYTANTVNWRYEAAFSTYQFRIQDKHPDAKGTGQNRFVANSIQFFGAKDWWYALRLESPGAGIYDVTLANGGANTGVAIAVYFLDGDEIDAALGANAVSYAETMSDEPYLAGSTDAFKAYKETIGTMLETATPAIETDFKSESQAFQNEASGEAVFTSDNAMVMVVKYTSEASLRCQLKSLTVTKTAELPEELRKKAENPADAPDYGKIFLYGGIGLFVLCAVVVVVVIANGKKKKATEE